MRLHNLNIRTQLQLGLGANLLLVMVLGLVAWFQAEHLWQATQGLYEHPLLVRRALGEFKADILTMQRDMKDLLLTEDEAERRACLQSIDSSEADAHRQLDRIFEAYLGPREDVELVQRALAEWKVIREESIRLVLDGRTAEAANRGRTAGIARGQVDSMLKQLDAVSRFALARGDKFYQDVREERDHLLLRLGILFLVILALFSTTGVLLWKGIREPLQELTAVAEQYRQGKMDARVEHLAGNEFGILAASFNDLAGTVQAELKRKEQAKFIAEVMLREQDLRALCHELLKALLEHTGSQIGAVYLLNERKTEFEHFASIGLDGAGRASFSAAGWEGEFGLALATRQTQRCADIPADTRFTFAAASGDFHPREILTIPILSETAVVGLVSLASLRPYPATATQLVNEVLGVMTARFNGALAFRQILEFSKKLEGQNLELEAQKKELATQAEELGEQNFELQMQKRALDEASRLKSSFLSNMSHELRTPLNSVIGLSGVLHRRLEGKVPEEERGYLAIIERNGRQLLELINDILDLSRIESGKEEFNLSHFSAHELAREVLTPLESQAREKKILVRNLVSAKLPLLHSDFNKLRHILQNLVGNAVKFTEVGKVEITAEQVEDNIQWKVADTGIGIPAEHLPHIFDEFRQGDGSTSRRFGGTGLGLAIARRYTLLLQGRIAVDSTPGKGSTFTVTLPMKLVLPARGEPKDQAALSGGADGNTFDPALSRGIGLNREPNLGVSGAGDIQRPRMVLLVEDSEPAVIQMTDILAEQGYQLRVARNGREALDQIAQSVPDAMILDLMMPGVDGFQVLRAVRDRDETAHLPVLILTAKHITREELSFLKENNVQQLIQKGDINKAELLAAVTRMIRQPGPGRDGPAAVQRDGATPSQAALCRDAAAARFVAPPRAPEAAEGSPIAPSLPPLDPPRKAPTRPSILVVEDNADNLHTVRALLYETATIIEAANGQECLEKARAHAPEVILLDLGLPVMDGFKTLEAIRREETLRHIPVVALTARAMKGDREHILGRGFDGYVSKPIDEPTLKETLRAVLHGA